jgi:hypothetical protein
MRPQLHAEVTLYPTGGREGPINGDRYGCPCLLTKDASDARDCRIILGGEPILLGQPRLVGFVFLSPDSADIFKNAGKFYLWEGRIIGEAKVVEMSGRKQASTKFQS